MNYSQKHYGAGDRSCHICGGIGYISYDVPTDHPKFGKVFSCQCRDDKSEEMIRLRIKQAGVTEEGWKLEKDFWSLPGRKALEEAVRDMAQRIANSDPSGWLTLVSPYGIGKSAMGEWLVIKAIQAGRKAWFMTSNDFERAVSTHIQGDSSMLNRALETEVLVFDQPDWVYEKTTETFQINQARGLLDRRYRMRDHQATALLLNLSAWENRAESGLSAIFNRAEEGKVVIARASGVRPAIGELIEEGVS